ncbi:MAG: hypothetical protein ACI4MG_06665 [Aristaeellaceae bacterium]
MKRIGQGIGRTAKKAVGAIRFKMKEMDSISRRRETISELGEKVYGLYGAGVQLPEEVQPLVSEIRSLDEGLDMLRNERAATKAAAAVAVAEEKAARKQARAEAKAARAEAKAAEKAAAEAKAAEKEAEAAAAAPAEEAAPVSSTTEVPAMEATEAVEIEPEAEDAPVPTIM